MRPALSILALLALGCPNDPDDPADAGVTLGTGTTEFEPLGEGDSLEVVAGPQGGFHFHVHARMSGLDPGDPAMPGLLDNPATTFAAFRVSDGAQLDFMFPPYRLGYLDVGGGEFELPSGRILQLQDSEVPTLFGEQVSLSVEIRDDRDRIATAEVTVIAVEEAGGGVSLDAGVDASGGQ
jgi:hypothetical protein